VSCRSGVIGRAILRGRPAASIRDGAFDAYIEILVRDYAVPRREARELPEDRFSFLAVPIHHRGTDRVAGVVYLESTDRTFLSGPDRPGDGVSGPFVRRIVDACGGLAAYAESAYPKESEP
jgi:hypothetical protein